MPLFRLRAAFSGQNETQPMEGWSRCHFDRSPVWAAMSEETEPQPEKRLRLYQLYLTAREANPIEGRFMPYDWSGLPNPLSGAWLPYSQMSDEFGRELANTINDLTNHVHRLRAWDEVIGPLPNEDRMEALHEFIGVLAVAALGLPYVIKSRFAYAAAHLCHQANRAKQATSWTDDFPTAQAIYLNDADTFGRQWRAFRRFKQRVEVIGATAFKDATGDFRNAYNHRFPRRLVLGLSGFVTRYVDPTTGRPFYGVGGTKALELADVVGLLSAERDRSYAAFDAYQDLIREHEAAIAAHG